VRERKGGGTHLSAHGIVVLPAEPRGAEPCDVVALTGFLGVEINKRNEEQYEIPQ
jgi:hypothetical protein